jgi:hypothetical protein
MQDGLAYAFRIKAIPMRLDDIHDGCSNGRGSVGVNNEVFLEFGLVTVGVPKMDIGALVQVGDRGAAEGAAVAFKQENALIQVVAIVDGNVSVNRLGPPNLGWDVDDKQVSQRESSGERSR